MPGTPKSRFIFITVPSGFRAVHRFYIKADGTASDFNFGLASIPLVTDKMIVTGTSDGYLYAVDQDNGRIITKVNLGAPVSGTASLAGNVLFVADFSENNSCFAVMNN